MPMMKAAPYPSLFVPGENCRTIARFQRFAPLIDGDAYFHALDSALAYRKSQAALEQTEQVQSDVRDDVVDPPEAKRARLWSPGARIAMISAPVIALLGPLVLDRLTRRRKP